MPVSNPDTNGAIMYPDFADHVSDLGRNQVSSLCLNGSRNYTSELNQRTTAAEMSEKTDEDDETHRTLVALIESCGFNDGQGDNEARSALAQCNGKREALVGWLRYALKEKSVRNPLGFAIDQTRKGRGGTRSRKPQGSLYPYFRGIDPDGKLVFD